MPVQAHPVKVELARRGQRQTEFAPVVGVSPNVLGQVLNGHIRPWPALRRRVAEALDLPEHVLFPEHTAGAAAAGERAAQGLGPTVTDPDALRRIGTAMRAARPTGPDLPGAA